MKKFIAPLSGLFVFSLASGYLMTLIPLKQDANSVSKEIIALTASAFYLGLLVASFNVEKVVSRIGHIRSFAGFIGILSASSLAFGLDDNIYLWLLLRFISGIAVAGAYVVIESWLLASSRPDIRGKVVSVYMVSLYGAQAASQAFVDFFPIDSLIPFIITGILLSISICPPVMTRLPHPEVKQPSKLDLLKLIQITPSGFLGCFMAGIILGAFYGLLPIYASKLRNEDISIALFMTCALGGGMLLQFPVGYLSDCFDRRKILIGINILGCIVSALMMVTESEVAKLVLVFFVGGTTFTLYPVCISHASDHFDGDDIIACAQALLLSYSLGSCVGPFIATYFMNYMEQGLMVFFIVCMGMLSIFFIVRLFFRPLIYTTEEQSFIPLPRTTPVVSSLETRSQDHE